MVNQMLMSSPQIQRYVCCYVWVHAAGLMINSWHHHSMSRPGLVPAWVHEHMKLPFAEPDRRTILATLIDSSLSVSHSSLGVRRGSFQSLPGITQDGTLYFLHAKHMSCNWGRFIPVSLESSWYQGWELFRLDCFDPEPGCTTIFDIAWRQHIDVLHLLSWTCEQFSTNSNQTSTQFYSKIFKTCWVTISIFVKPLAGGPFLIHRCRIHVSTACNVQLSDINLGMPPHISGKW